MTTLTEAAESTVLPGKTASAITAVPAKVGTKPTAHSGTDVVALGATLSSIQQGMKVVTSSLDAGLLSQTIPGPLKNLLHRIVQKRVDQGWGLDASRGIVHTGSGAVRLVESTKGTNALYFTSSKTSNYGAGTIRVSDRESDGLELILHSTAKDAPRIANHIPSSDAAFVMQLVDKPTGVAWLNGSGEWGTTLAKAIEGLPSNSFSMVRTHFLEFDAQGNYLRTATFSRPWDVARPR